MFLDEAEADVKAGDGGNGIVAFRREKYVPRGGPAGGNGGRGGDVIFVADEGVNTLYAFRFTKRYEAGRGGHGGGNNRRGKDGDDLRVTVPLGTIVRDAATGLVLADLVAHGQEVVVAKGGAPVGETRPSRARPNRLPATPRRVSRERPCGWRWSCG